MRRYLMVLLITAGYAISPAIACTPAPGYTPPSVRDLYETAAYVLHARVTAIDEAAGGRRARVRILERFKGPAPDSIGASGEGCALTLSVGETRVFFLDDSANGHVMAYPIGKSEPDILRELKALKEHRSHAAAGHERPAGPALP